MAQGTFIYFAQAKLDVGDKLHDLSTDTFKLSLIKNAAGGGVNPTETTADPRWGAGGTTNLLSSEVTPGGNYSTGGTTLGAADHWTLSTATAKFDGDDITFTQNASNPTNAAWGIVYNDTDAGKRAIGYLELTSDSTSNVVDMTTGDLAVVWNAAGIFTLA